MTYVEYVERILVPSAIRFKARERRERRAQNKAMRKLKFKPGPLKIRLQK